MISSLQYFSYIRIYQCVIRLIILFIFLRIRFINSKQLYFLYHFFASFYESSKGRTQGFDLVMVVRLNPCNSILYHFWINYTFSYYHFYHVLFAPKLNWQSGRLLTIGYGFKSHGCTLITPIVNRQNDRLITGGWVFDYSRRIYINIAPVVNG